MRMGSQQKQHQHEILRIFAKQNNKRSVVAKAREYGYFPPQRKQIQQK